VNFIANQRQLSQIENDGLNFAVEIIQTEGFPDLLQVKTSFLIFEKTSIQTDSIF